MKVMAIVLLLWGVSAASASSEGFHMNMRVGHFAGQLKGNYVLTNVNFALNSAVEIEMEIQRSLQTSFFLRGAQAGGAQFEPKYRYLGGGQRYFFAPKTAGNDRTPADIGKVNQYVGYDVGTARLLPSIGILSLHTDLLRAGLEYGFLYQVTREFGLQAQVGVGYLTSYSGFASSGTTSQLSVGGSYYF